MNNVESQIGLMNQSELSTMVGVDRGLIIKWQKYGLPYREYGTGTLYIDFGLSDSETYFRLGILRGIGVY